MYLVVKIQLTVVNVITLNKGGVEMIDHSGTAKQQFEENGYVLFHNVLDDELIGEAREHIEWLARTYPELRPEHMGIGPIKNLDPFWIRLVSDPRLLDVAEQFIGPNIALFATHYITKPPHDGMPVLWHQDGSYWPLDPISDVITLWLAVDDSLLENGCMRVIPKTHTMELQKLNRRVDVKNVLDSEVDPKLVDESQAVDLVLKAGSVSIHHPNIIHGSAANHSPLRRCGLTIRYIPTTTRITSEQKPWPGAYLLRGNAIPGVNEYLPYPAFIPGKHMSFKGSDKWV
jgi:phytanoyl-CoA hydroxylase